MVSIILIAIVFPQALRLRPARGVLGMGLYMPTIIGTSTPQTTNPLKLNNPIPYPYPLKTKAIQAKHGIQILLTGR